MLRPSWPEAPITAIDRLAPAAPRPGYILGALAAVCLIGGVAAAQSQRANLERLNLEESELAAQQGRNLNQLARLLTVLQRLRRDPPPALLVSPTDARDAVRAAILVKAMTPELQDRAQQYSVEAAEIARQRRLAAVRSEAMFTRESEAAEELRGTVDDNALMTSEPDIARLPPPDQRAAPLSALLPPAQGRVSQAFGANLPGGGHANGLTIITAKGAPVQSPGGGDVVYVGPVKGWGVILILRMAGGYHLVLGGLDRATVGVGQSVAVGAPVGFMPNERQSASELYFEVRQNGVPVNPTRWMRTKTG